MAWTTPSDRATGFLVTAAVYNAELIDNLAYLHGDAGNVVLTAGGATYIFTEVDASVLKATQSLGSFGIQQLAAGDTSPRFSVVNVATGAQIDFGLGSASPDTTVARSAPGQITLGGTAGKGNIIGGGASNNVGGPATITPDAACLFNRYVLINASGTYTIAAPTNPPSGNQSALMIICLHNASGGTVTVTWSLAYNTTPTTPTNSNGNVIGFAWNPGTSKWDLVFQTGIIVD